jgi:small subunit ribosomal protein S18
VTAKESQRARRAAQLGVRPRKKNLLAGLGLSAVDYKDTAALRMFISERGKIRSPQVTGLTVQQQRQVSAAIKKFARNGATALPGTIR